jgi:hypothetical protein
MRVKLFELAMGPAAVARFLGVPLDFDLLNGPNCRGNLKDMVKYTVAAGVDVAIDHMNDACALANGIVQHYGWTGAAAIKAAGRRCLDGGRPCCHEHEPSG